MKCDSNQSSQPTSPVSITKPDLEEFSSREISEKPDWKNGSRPRSTKTDAKSGKESRSDWNGTIIRRNEVIGAERQNKNEYKKSYEWLSRFENVSERPMLQFRVDLDDWKQRMNADLRVDDDSGRNLRKTRNDHHIQPTTGGKSKGEDDNMRYLNGIDANLNRNDWPNQDACQRHDYVHCYDVNHNRRHSTKPVLKLQTKNNDNDVYGDDSIENGGLVENASGETVKLEKQNGEWMTWVNEAFDSIGA